MTDNNEVQAIPSMPSHEYHAHNAVSASGVKQFRANRRAYYEIFEARTQPPEPPTDNLLFGTCIHTLTLEGVESTMIEIPEGVLTSNGQRRGKAWDEFEASCAERKLIPLKSDDYQRLKRIVKNLQEHPRARELLYGDDAVVEESIFWTDPDTHLRLRCRPDVRRHIGYFRTGVDLKGMADGTPEAFAWAITRNGYDIQDYLYRQGMFHRTGEDHGFTFVVVEKEWPHDVYCYELDDEYQKLAESKTRAALEEIATCRMTGNWNRPGWDTIQLLPPPYRAKFANQWEYVE